jgi:hypothetical protein
MGTISGCRYLKVNLKAKIYIYVKSTIQRCPNKIIKIFWLKILIPRNQFCQPKKPGGPVRQPYSYSVSSPHSLFKNSGTGERDGEGEWKSLEAMELKRVAIVLNCGSAIISVFF